MLSKKLANFVRHKGGRFLQKCDSENVWYECGDERAHGKCAQALREGSAEVMREANVMDVIESDSQHAFSKSAPTMGINVSNTYLHGLHRPQVPPTMAFAVAHRAATGQHLSVQNGITQRHESAGEEPTSEGSKGASLRHIESGVAFTDENRPCKAGRVRARDWENDDGFNGSDDDGEEEGHDEDEDHQEDESVEDSPSRKRTKTHHEDESEHVDYI